MIGARVSHFEILERLGAGGMGVVYKARDTRLDRLVALKFLSPQRDGEDDRQRFLREARAASALDHPNICTLYEIGETEDGRLFLAMSLCDGESLRRRIDRGPLEPAEAVGIAAQIADGLAAAHERGIVHRDVKPGNVLLTAGGRVRIVDFGIARLADVTRLTRAGTALGTAAYMAPEQIRGEEPDPRMDIWALGVVLYEMLAGCLPFPEGDEKEVIGAILNDPPRPLAACRFGLPAGCERIVSRALAKRPADRWPRAAEMAEELRRLERSIREGRTADWRTAESTLLEVPGRTGSQAAAQEPALITGRGLQRYRIVGPLGAGAMGVVQEAEDLDLGRHVALKFLPTELSLDPEAKERFLREARAASALDHPNVCTIHEVGESRDGRLYLAMACYEGETLQKRLASGPLPLAEALDLGRQIAHGLASAHRHGIVHRDIKPANLMLTRDGVVKILDFGIARLAGQAGLTRLGATMGTPAYMSPEQARGEEVGPASDVWSLGAVLYEMLAGRRPFPGDHEQAVLYAVLHEEPKPLRALRPEIPPEVERIVHRMLARDPAARYPSAEEAHADLKALFGPTSGKTVVHPSRTTPLRVWLAAALGTAALAAIVLLVLVWGGRREGDEPVGGTFTRLTDLEGSETFPSLSPDGTYFLYSKSEEGNADIYLQRVGGGNPMDLTADSPVDDTQAAFSPDGQQIAFRSERAGGGIFLMGATGESVRRLTGFGYNPAWSPDGKEILVATEEVSGPETRLSKSQVWRIDAATGARRPLLQGDAVQPSWSPHGWRIAYWSVSPGFGQRVLWTVPAAGGQPSRVTDDAYLNWNPVWSPDGEHLYYASDRGGSMNLWRLAIDERTGEVRGAPEPVTTPAPWSGLLSFSRDGRRIVFATREGRSNLERAPLGGGQAGARTPVTRGARAVRFGDVSPDGQWIAFDTASPREDLFVVRADGSGLRQLTSDGFKDRIPRWSPDGRRIAFYSDRSGRYEAWAIRPDGSGLEPLTRTPKSYITGPVWSPDGSRLVCTAGPRGAALIDLALPLARRTARPLPPIDAAGEVFIATSWSPDGLALVGTAQRSDESPFPGVFLYRFDTERYVRLWATGDRAAWLPDNRTVLVQDRGRIVAVDAETRKARVVADPPPHSRFTAMSARPDGRMLFLVRATEEGDIWRLDLS